MFGSKVVLTAVYSEGSHVSSPVPIDARDGVLEGELVLGVAAVVENGGDRHLLGHLVTAGRAQEQQEVQEGHREGRQEGHREGRQEGHREGDLPVTLPHFL